MNWGNGPSKAETSLNPPPTECLKNNFLHLQYGASVLIVWDASAVPPFFALGKLCAFSLVQFFGAFFSDFLSSAGKIIFWLENFGFWTISLHLIFCIFHLVFGQQVAFL